MTGNAFQNASPLLLLDVVMHPLRQQRRSARQTAAVINAATAICPNTCPYICTVSFGNGTTCGPPDSSPTPVNVAIHPANEFASPKPTNHAPITVLTKCFGDNFVTIDKPMGDWLNSPVVCKRIPTSNHDIETIPRLVGRILCSIPQRDKTKRQLRKGQSRISPAYLVPVRALRETPTMQ